MYYSTTKSIAHVIEILYIRNSRKLLRNISPDRHILLPREIPTRKKTT